MPLVIIRKNSKGPPVALHPARHSFIPGTGHGTLQFFIGRLRSGLVIVPNALELLLIMHVRLPERRVVKAPRPVQRFSDDRRLGPRLATRDKPHQDEDHENCRHATAGLPPGIWIASKLVKNERYFPQCN